jgi:imidazoleglycerol-phosphate dehydratase/histidinol-phosphatase
MLEQIAKHGKFDLKIDCKGDLKVDEHHTIEDVAICLGEVFLQALGDKKGIERFASERFVPMDESLAYVAIDVSGRPFCVFDAKFEREYCGDMPTEMVEHFFQSFAVASKMNINIKIDGKNTHHKIESCFKAFGKVLYDASRVVNNNISSTKGVL